MSIRLSVIALLLLVLPVDAQAAGYIIRPGDTLTAIAQRYHVPVLALARANGIRNVNLIHAGGRLTIPTVTRYFGYRVRWGDTLSGIAARFGMTIPAVRALNPALGDYPLAGEELRLCTGCAGPPSAAIIQAAPAAVPVRYVVQSGDSLSAIAAQYGMTAEALAAANGIATPDLLVIGTALTIPSAGSSSSGAPAGVLRLIERYAALYAIDPSVPAAVAWQESGYNQNVVSVTGAVGVMQVEPYTAARIDALLGMRLNIYNLDDNVRAGVYWLSVLLRYYGGDEQLAVAAYYQGTRSIARFGLYPDTRRYVANVLALQTRVTV